MSSEAKAHTAALHLQFKEELRQVELLEQEEKRAEELGMQEEERVLQEQECQIPKFCRVIGSRDSVL